ncbi:B12-binding domain-containing radical SAM protein [Candidatus Woesearchaeota archaeon]|nr:B12-binding domain-containing radical SAM protein [Candidatus Woesearchaeota archaeon]
MKIYLINVLNHRKKIPMNKDLNGGFGTADYYGKDLASFIIRAVKHKSIRIPVLSMAYLQAILKKKGHDVGFFEAKLPIASAGNNPDLILIYGTIVDYKNENRAYQILKKRFPDANIGFTGPFPSSMPDLFKGDFVIIGEPEAYFLNEFKNTKLKGNVVVDGMADMDALPTPDFDGFPIDSFGYNPALIRKPFVTLLSSKGCPYSCRYYCAYGTMQGPKIRQRSAVNVVDDIIKLQEKYGIMALQFRDPCFGVSIKFVEDFCNLLIKKKIRIEWGIETRLDLLNRQIIQKMYKAGLRNINIGIETSNEEIATRNKRKIYPLQKQESIVRFCNNLGVKLSAFYMFGYEDETVDNMKQTLEYAKKLNTILARFCIATPYPNTPHYDVVKKEGRIITDDFEKYTQFNLVFKHNVAEKALMKMLRTAYREYYFRLSYILGFIGWKIRDFLS